MDAEWHKQYSKTWYQKNLANARKMRKQWQKDNPEKQKGYRLKQRFGISLEGYLEALEKQGTKCAICSSKLIPGKNCHLDHCHKTGKLRGFLCGPCNKGLGSFRDSIENIKNAANYLESAELYIPKVV